MFAALADIYLIFATCGRLGPKPYKSSFSGQNLAPTIAKTLGLRRCVWKAITCCPPMPRKLLRGKTKIRFAPRFVTEGAGGEQVSL